MSTRKNRWPTPSFTVAYGFGTWKRLLDGVEASAPGPAFLAQSTVGGAAPVSGYWVKGIMGGGSANPDDGLLNTSTLAEMGLAVGDTISVGIFSVAASQATRLQFSVEFMNGGSIVGSPSLATAKVVATNTPYGDASAPDPSFKIDGLVIPATTTAIRLRIVNVAGTGAANWGNNHGPFAAAVMIEKAATLGTYVDGDRGGAYGWDGTAGASPSTFYTPEMTLEPFIDEAPSPRVRITVIDLYPETERITLYRTAGGRTNTVRDAIQLFAQGGFVVIDYEAGLQTDLSYEAMQFDTNGDELGYTPVGVTTLDTDLSYISDPLRPLNSIAVEFTDKAGARPSRPIPGEVHRVNTADGIRMIALTGPRGLLQGMTMDFYTSTLDDYERMQEIIDEANGLLLIRTPPPMPVPRSFYVFASNPIPDDFNFPAGLEDVEWANVVDETTQPELGVSDPLVTWQTYIDAFPLWSDMDTAYSTWLDAIANPPGV